MNHPTKSSFLPAENSSSTLFLILHDAKKSKLLFSHEVRSVNFPLNIRPPHSRDFCQLNFSKESTFPFYK